VTPRQPDLPAWAVQTLVARHLGPGASIDRAPEGVSSQVYRIARGEGVWYLRVAEEAGLSMAPEVEVHTRLRSLGIRVPAVVAFDELAPEIGRSMMVVREVAGEALSSAVDRPTAAVVLRDAGRDLARVNELPVDGFGWIRRDAGGWPLRGEEDSYAGFVRADIGELAALGARILSPDELRALERVLDEAAEDPPQPRLVHGDVCPPAIFHVGSTFTGLIDFGEIRGAEWYFDLAYIFLSDGEDLPFPILDDLLAGYREVTELPDELPSLLRRSAAVFAINQLARWLARDGEPGLTSSVARSRIARLQQLLLPA
jgi:Ser/Thr protein kinase RdoA (MazF antagonist)